ncbi:MAG: DUF192 domain-containing protein [Solirubrobacterales bacterium]
METIAGSRQGQTRRFRSLPVQNLAGFEVPVADGLLARLLGLSWLDRERAGRGLLIPHCHSVHTFGMRFPIDVYFLGDDDRLLRACKGIPPGRVLGCAGARDVLELVSPERGERLRLPGLS